MGKWYSSCMSIQIFKNHFYGYQGNPERKGIKEIPINKKENKKSLMKVAINNAFHSFQIKFEYQLYDKIDKENAVFHYQAN